MQKQRLEAFSDGVIAIIITIMVLQISVPEGNTWADLVHLWPVFLSYVLSFLFVGIYWNNHHHLMQATPAISGGTLWANLHLLFWLSLLPFTTAWMDETRFARAPTMLYGLNLLACSMAYHALQAQLIGQQGPAGAMARAVGRNLKGKLSMLLFLGGVLAAAVLAPLVGFAVYTLVMLMWLVPDRRMETAMASAGSVNQSD